MVSSLYRLLGIFIYATNTTINFLLYLFNDEKKIQPEKKQTETHVTVLPSVPEESLFEESIFEEQLLEEQPLVKLEVMSSSMETVDLNIEPLEHLINEVRLMSRTPTPTPSVSSSSSWEVVSENDQFLEETKIISNL